MSRAGEDLEAWLAAAAPDQFRCEFTKDYANPFIDGDTLTEVCLNVATHTTWWQMPVGHQMHRYLCRKHLEEWLGSPEAEGGIWDNLPGHLLDRTREYERRIVSATYSIDLDAPGVRAALFGEEDP